VLGITVSVAVLVTPAYDAERVTFFTIDTWLVKTVNTLLVAPAGTVTLLGTEAALGLLEASAITVPPAGAGPLRVTVA
jgi:hypothetical protein